MLFYVEIKLGVNKLLGKKKPRSLGLTGVNQGSAWGNRTQCCPLREVSGLRRATALLHKTTSS